MKTIRPKTARPRVALLIETSNVYGRNLLKGIAHYVRLHGSWHIEFEAGDSIEKFPEWLKNWKADGVIARVKTSAAAKALKKLDVPVVDLYGGVPGLGMPVIRSDDVAVGRLAAQHFLERGFRHFAFCGFNGTEWSDLRKEGFTRVLAAVGFSCETFLNVRPPAGPATEYEEHGSKKLSRVAEWLRSLPKPVGLMACNDERARQILDECGQIGLRVPDDVAVIGVDNDEIYCDLSNVPLSSVILNVHHIGYEAAALLDRMLAGEKPPRHAITIEPRGIATRQSTDVLAVEDRHIAAALRFIREHACEGMSVPDILKVVPLPRRMLERRFARVIGRSPKEEIIRVQINRVKELLHDSDMSVAAAAEKTGFNNLAYLSRLFKKKSGLTPARFRKQSRLIVASRKP